jgi:hypothetical protein
MVLLTSTVLNSIEQKVLKGDLEMEVVKWRCEIGGLKMEVFRIGS